MRNPLPRTLSFKLIGKNNSTGEMESRRIILRKARTESKLHIVLKVLAYCYFWDRNLIIEPRFRLNRYKPDLIVWRESEIPIKEELIPDLWIECKAVKLKKLIKLSRALPYSKVVWIHLLQPLSRIIKNFKSRKTKNQLTSNVQLIGIETSRRNWIFLEESIETNHLQWVVTQQAIDSMEIFIRSRRSDPIPLQFHVLSTAIKT